ncbi:MAG: DedA family protein [Alphaproteobacteria bacterium]|jgi:membrane protein YqaA with SNARE-associated domain|nr:DedA family protein [Alphaproteobacteria bacterium]
MSSIEVYIILFTSSFASSTILPGHSEITLIALITQKKYEVFYLVFFASLGNILGSVLNWYLGLYFLKFKNKKWFPFNENQIKKVSKSFLEYGKWSLLLSWVPFIGDVLTLVAGMFRVPLYQFVVIVSVAKVSRYIFVSLIALNVF